MEKESSFSKIQEFVGINEEDISDRYFSLLIFFFTIFLSTQVIYVLFITTNWSNIITTIVTFFIFLSFFFVIKNKKYRQKMKLFFLGIIHILLIFFWISSEGLLGSITTMLPISVFIVTIISPRRYNKTTLIFSILFYLSLSCVEFVFPNIIIPYSSLLAKKTDIFMGVIFTSVIVGFSFYYLREEYEKKVDELKKQYDEQKRLNEELDNFVYKTSHDLRAPISSSLGLLDLMKITDKETEKEYYLELQKKSLLKMDQFIHEILNYSRNSRMEIAAKKIDFLDIYTESVRQIQYVNPNQHIQLSFDCPDNVNFISDELRIQIIFNNILSNAFKYYDKAKENPYMKVQISQNEGFVKIVFEDNGQGIKEDSIPKIFEMFYRANKHSEGSGVGLYIVKQSVEKLQGKISCESVLGKGTKFVILLPNVLK